MVSHLDDATLALLALGEGPPDPAGEDHLASCARCRDTLTGYRRVVDTGRSIDPADHPVMPRVQVWQGIAAEAARPTTSRDEPARPDVPDEPDASRSRRFRRWAPLAAAAVVGAVVGAGGAWGVIRDTAPAGEQAGGGQVSVAVLQPLDNPAARGRAVLRVTSSARRTVTITVTGLTMPTGTFYEVWLMDPSNAHLVALGVLSSTGRGVYAVPPGLDLSRYSAVDVSLQQMNGSPLHSGDSAVRGSIRS